ncbi:MAG TPA: ABC transporter substrate-binding protein [Acetobacteraceae bacterium]|nr:ABC transporter substrate-binding protein [Acetobacteraceae bacterium]
METNDLMRRTRVRLAALVLAGLVAFPGLASAKDKVVVYQAFQSLNYLPLYVGIDTGTFAAHGLDVEKVTAGSGAAGVSAVIGGQSTFSLQDPMTAVLANLRGAKLTNVAMVVDGAPVWIIVPKSSPITSVAGLKGNNVATAIPPSTSTYLLQRLAKAQNLPIKLDTVQLGTEAAPVTVGRDAAGAVYEPQLDQALSAGDRILYAFTQHFPGGYAFSTIDTLQSTVTSKPALVQAFVTGLADAEHTIHARPELAVQIAEQEFPTLPKPIVQAAVARMAAADVYPQDPSISTQAFANALALQVFVGNVKSGQVSYADSVDNQFALAAGKAEANK